MTGPGSWPDRLAGWVYDRAADLDRAARDAWRWWEKLVEDLRA